jgi:putative SOS response-associated peptidase YedK
MCYSAQITASYKKYVREFGAKLSIHDFVDLFFGRSGDPSIQIPKGMEAEFADGQTERGEEVKQHIDRYRQQQVVKFEGELSAQRGRLVEAERKLAVKVTKAAEESKRIALKKIDWALGKLADLNRADPLQQDSRIFPGSYVPVMVVENGERVIKPMRYQCRPAGKPSFYDVKFPGTYNARMDNLGGFWKGLFGYTHGIVIFDSFYEIVSHHRLEQRALAPGEKDEKVVLQFTPNPPQDLLVACLWSRWTGPNVPDLLSFAAITDEPLPEVAAAGHDRCIVTIKPANVQAWLNPDPDNLTAQYAILEDRVRPRFEHRVVG